MEKIWGLIVLIFIILILPNVSAIRINEVELNPKDDCFDCTEWAELYSEVEINLSEYWIENNKSNVINLSGTGKGYIKINFGKRFLTNSGDKLILKKDGQIIDETPILIDKKNDNKTWQLCEIWEFIDSTKGEENDCMVEEVQENNNDTQETPLINDTDTEQEPKESTAETTNTTDNGNGASGGEEKNKKLEIIRLNSKVIKSDDDSESLNKNAYAIYGFVTFCILLVFLFVLRKYNLKKNEFEG